MRIITSLLLFLIGFSRNSSAQLPGSTTDILLNNVAIKEGHVGVSIYNLNTKTYLYNHNGEKFFTPASNQKIFTLYAGLSTLGDSLAAAIVYPTKEKLYLQPMADPSFLLKEFPNQRLLEYLKLEQTPIVLTMDSWQETPMGKGWMWDDYTDEFSAERSAFPIYGNNVSIEGTASTFQVVPSYFTSSVQWASKPFYSADTNNIQRAFNDNIFYAPQKEVKKAVLPFLTHDGRTNASLLEDTTNRTVIYTTDKFPIPHTSAAATIIYSIKAKELFRPMMERSDNFFAEQTLLMSAMKSTGTMNIDSFLKKFTEEKLSDMPQQTQWVDGSGLSRYNLCTPQSIIYVLDKIQQEFGMNTVKELFMTGGEGTIKSYYTSIAGSIFAKTGTLSDNSAFSGYLITKNKNLLAFSLMANNYQKGGRSIRLAFQEFLMKVWETQ